jgi:diacylglycerol O-acyltransferase / wax synthase
VNRDDMGMKRLSGLDAALFALETPTMHMHVSAVLIFEPSGESGAPEPAAMGFERMRRVFAERIDSVPMFRRRVVSVPFGLDHPMWLEDETVDLDFHLRRLNLPTPGGPRELAEVVSDIVSRPLDTKRPPWEMYFVEGLESGHVAVVPKLHHCMIDGVAATEMMGSLLDLSPMAPAGETRLPLPPRRPRQAPTAPELVVGALSSLVRHPERAAGALVETLSAARRLSERNRRLREEDGMEPPPGLFRAPRTSLNGAISAHRRYAFVQAPFEDLVSVKRRMGGTVNDVLLAAVAGALRKLLSLRGDSLSDSLVAMVPISVREQQTTRKRADEDAADTVATAAPGNQVSATLVSLATAVADPLERLRVIAAGTRLAKEQAKVLSEDVVRGWAQIAFPAFSSRIARLTGNLRVFDHVPPLFNVIVSNITGPQIPLWFGGSRLVAVYPVGPLVEGVGLNVTAISHMGALYVGLLGCRELVPEVDHLAGLLGDSLRELVKAALRNGDHWA